MQSQYSVKRFCMALESKIKILITPQAYICFAIMVLLIPFQWVVAWILAAVCHEVFHCVALFLCGGTVQSIQIGATGTKIQTCALKGIKAVCCALFGPIGSLLLLLLSQQFPRLAVCALTQATFNLLPVYPLDGGRALLGCLEILFSEEWADKLFRILECIILCLLCVLLSSICNLHYGLFCGLLNW